MTRRRTCARPRRGHAGWWCSSAGFTLIEVLAALTILAVSAGAVVVLASQVGEAVVHAGEREAAIDRASSFMDLVSLWPREDLDRHLGDHPQGSWRLRVDRPRSDFYSLTLSDSGSGEVMIRTDVYRPEPPAAEASYAAQ